MAISFDVIALGAMLVTILIKWNISTVNYFPKALEEINGNYGGFVSHIYVLIIREKHITKLRKPQ